MNEAETRAKHIDQALKAAGGGVVESSCILREHAVADWGGTVQIRTLFAGFQKYLYADDTGARHALQQG